MWKSILSVFIVTTVISISQCKENNYDNFDLEAVLSNPERLKQIVQCIHDNSKCIGEDWKIKRDVLEMMETQCKSCSEKEKEKFAELEKRIHEDPQVANIVRSGGETIPNLTMAEPSQETTRETTKVDPTQAATSADPAQAATSADPVQAATTAAADPAPETQPKETTATTAS